MGKDTAISWCDSSWNAWWGCQKVSEGCRNCYALTLSKRVGWDIWGAANTRRRFFGDKHWNEPVNWNRKAEAEGVRRKVFCGSMMDWAEDRPDLMAPRQRLFNLVEATPWLDWLMLTKRPENIVGMIPDAWKASPLPNVWMGTTTENQEYADKRTPLLLQVPARVRFLSVEPMVGPVTIKPEYLDRLHDWPKNLGTVGNVEPTIHWVICGAESGAKARPMHPQWARDLRDQCKTAGVPFFYKQWGEWAPCYELDHDPELQARILEGKVKEHKWDTGLGGETLAYRVGKDKSGDLLDGQQHHEFPT